MLRLLLLCWVLVIVHCNCPAGFNLVADGECRGWAGSDNNYSDGQAMQLALSKCTAKGGAFPVAIHSDEQVSYWLAYKANGYPIILGLTCNSVTKQWEWADGTSLDYKPPTGSYDKELDGECVTTCTWFLDRGNRNWYHDCTHSYPYAEYFCIAHLKQPVASTDCGSFDDDSDDSVCYEIAVHTENWQDAQAICHSFGAEVASVHSVQENNYLRRMAVSRGATNGLLLGGTLSGKGNNEFGWIDGSEWDYSNFYPSFPIDGLEDCLTMDTLSTAGQWMNTDCNTKQPIACSRPLLDAPEKNGCLAGPWKEGQIIYSPGFPNDASVPCDYFLQVPTGKLVKLEILLLEANTCCDRLLLTDGYVSGPIIANLSGEISGAYYYTSTSNIMRVAWQPEGGVNVRGLMMTFWTK